MSVRIRGSGMAPLAVLLALSVLVGCAANGGGTASLNSASAAGPAAADFTLKLFVSNQSFEVDPVDIEVRVDGDVVAVGEFAVGNQHNWREFVVDLEPGRHELTAVSKSGGCSLSREIEISGDRWATVSFWFYPETHYQPTPAQLVFDIRDEPMLFD